MKTQKTKARPPHAGDKQKTTPQPIDYVITHKNLVEGKDEPKTKTLGFKRLKDARKTALIMYRNSTFIRLTNAKGIILTI